MSNDSDFRCVDKLFLVYCVRVAERARKHQKAEINDMELPFLWQYKKRGEGVMKEEKFPHDKKPSHKHVNGEL